MEATEFRDRYVSFQALGVQIYGLSPDNLESHRAFAAKHDLTFPLLYDAESKWLDQVGLWVEREHEGKKFMGALRTTMFVDPEGIIVRLWESVQFKDHAEEVLETVRKEMDL